MKKLFTLIFILSSLLTIAQEESLKEAQKLIENKKYESALKVLNEADPNNENPDIVIEKVDLFLNYFVSSIMHQLFAVTDLEAKQNIYEIRGSEGNFSMFKFPPDSILINLIDKYPNDYRLYKELGFYYHEVHLKYGGNWLKPDSTLINLFVENYKLAYENGVYDDWSLYGIGYGLLYTQKYQESIKYFKEAINLKPEYPTSHYNLAYAYLSLDDRENAIESAKKALELYEYPPEKADAARIVAVCYSELEQYEKSMEYYRISNEIDPNNYYTLKPLLSVEIYLNDEAYKKRTKDFFLLAPGNPTIYQNLMEAYWKNEKQNELIEFFESLKTEFENDNKVYANLYFYIAIIQYDSEDFENSKVNFGKSKEIFRNVFEPNHDVFKAIDSYLKEI